MRGLLSTVITAAWFSTTLLTCSAGPATDPPYDLSHVDGMNCFAGCVEAQELLAKQGFVVAAPEFRQIFEAYIQTPVPVFVTPDSAWHTYHVALEAGVKEMEGAQSRRLAEFSRRLLQAALVQAASGAEFQSLAAYASVGLAFQDQAFRASLTPDQKRLIENLLKGTAPVPAPIGFALSPVAFRPQSFYADSPDLAAFYSARQWYACVDFRLSNARETSLALCLSCLIESDPALLKLWRLLTEPYETFVAPPEDGTVPLYHRTAAELLSREFGPPAFSSQIASLQQRLAAVTPVPRINDQCLSPAEYANFVRVTRGFRLLPAGQLPCQVCFQNTVDPKIPGRMFPSGLDFMAASRVMRSAAALGAAELQFGKGVALGVQKTDCPPMPDSLYGRSMELLSKLQERLPAGVSYPYRTDAWADLQLWTQLAAWSEQRHTWALYAKNGASYGGGATPPPGIVAPYPAFFSGLARLARESAKAFEAAAPELLAPKAAAAELLELEALMHNHYNGMSQEELAKIRDKTDHFSRFIDELYARHPAEMMTNARALHADLDEQLQRIASTGPTNEADEEILKMYLDTRLASAPQLTSLGTMCDRLAEFAQKQLEGKQLNHDEANWVRDYGKKLAYFHGYWGNSWLVPLDDFSLVTRIFDNQLERSVLYAGVARPQALYLVLPYKGGLQLYRGAVLSYREFVRPEAERLDDKAWRKEVSAGKAPDPPRFTASFLKPRQPGPNEKQAGLGAFSELRPGKPAAIKLEVREVSLGPSPTQWVWHEGWITPSEDCRHVAYRARNGTKWHIVRDGVPGREYDNANTQRFSPDSEHLAYVARAGGGFRVVLDEKAGEPFSRIDETSKGQWPYEFSPDSSRLAYVATIEEGKQCVVVDGKRGPAFDEVLHHSFSFSGNSRHFAYAARRGTQYMVVKDSEELLPAEGIANSLQAFGDARIGETFGPFLSPDGQQLAYSVQRDSNYVAIVNGVESAPWDAINCLVAPGEEFARFSPDGRHFAFVGMRGDQYFAVVDQKEHPHAWMGCAVFSPDGNRVAFAQYHEEPGKPALSSVVLNGAPGKAFSGTIEQLVFSPDGQRLAYRVSEGIMGASYVVEHGGEEFDDYDSSGEISFSPDSRHLAFLGRKQGSTFFVIDGQKHLKNEGSDSGGRSDYFTFSPDSQKWAYIAHHDKGMYAVVSGAEFGPYQWLSVPDEEACVYFSPDSRHFAFMACKGDSDTNNYGPQLLVVDGVEHAIPGNWLSCSVLRFDSPTLLHGLVMGQERMYRLEVEIKQR